MSAQSSSSVHLVKRNLLAELSSRTSTQRSPSSSQISSSSLAPTPDFLQEQRKTLGDYFDMSLETIYQAKDLDNMERIVLTLIQHTSSLRERTNLEDLMSRLAELRENVPNTMTLIETAQAQRKSLPRKSSDLDASLVQGHKQLSSLDAELSRLSEEEEKLEVEIQRLIAKKKRRAAWSQELSCFSIGKDQWKGI